MRLHIYFLRFSSNSSSPKGLKEHVAQNSGEAQFKGEENLRSLGT